MPEDTDPPRRPRGRPPTGRANYDPPQTAGRQPPDLWAACTEQAKADGQSMTQFVTDAIRRELTRRQQQT